MRYFSWRLAFLLAFVQMLAVLTLGMLIFMNAFGRAMFQVGPFARARPQAAPHPAGYEIAFSILIQPAALLLPQFDHLSPPFALGLAALNSLVWGIAFAIVIALIRRLFGRAKKSAPERMPIVE